MEPEKFKIEIESQGDYDTKKEFNIQLMMTGKEFLDFVGNILAYVNTQKLGEYKKPAK